MCSHSFLIYLKFSKKNPQVWIEVKWHTIMWNIFLLTIFCIILLFFFYYAFKCSIVYSGPIEKVFNNRLMTVLSRLSYAVYLVNISVLMSIENRQTTSVIPTAELAVSKWVFPFCTLRNMCTRPTRVFQITSRLWISARNLETHINYVKLCIIWTRDTCHKQSTWRIYLLVMIVV